MGWNSSDSVDAEPDSSATSGPRGRESQTYTLFEGTSEIQRLVVARAISGLHIP